MWHGNKQVGEIFMGHQSRLISSKKEHPRRSHSGLIVHIDLTPLLVLFNPFVFLKE